MLSVVCYRWGTRYTSEHVNRLYRQCKQHIAQEFEMLCVTDNPMGLDPKIVRVPLNRDWVSLGNAYPKLETFAPGRIMGDRVLMLDLDIQILGSIDELIEGAGPFKIWRDAMYPKQGYLYNSSIVLKDHDVHTKVFTDFRPHKTPDLLKAKGWRTSDQAQISEVVGEGAEVWTAEDGVYSYKLDLPNKEKPPKGTKIVVFHGQPKPWDLNHSWITN